MGRLVHLLPAMVVGFRVTPCWGEGGLHGYSLPGERVGLIYFLLGSWFYGYFPLGKLVSGLLPAGGEGGLHDYPLLGG